MPCRPTSGRWWPKLPIPPCAAILPKRVGSRRKCVRKVDSRQFECSNDVNEQSRAGNANRTLFVPRFCAIQPRSRVRCDGHVLFTCRPSHCAPIGRRRCALIRGCCTGGRRHLFPEISPRTLGQRRPSGFVRPTITTIKFGTAMRC